MTTKAELRGGNKARERLPAQKFEGKKGGQLNPVQRNYLAEGGHLLVGVGHGVLREGGVGHICGPRVPAVEEGGPGTLVPLDTNPNTFSPVKKQKKKKTTQTSVGTVNPESSLSKLLAL